MEAYFIYLMIFLSLESETLQFPHPFFEAIRTLKPFLHFLQ